MQPWPRCLHPGHPLLAPHRASITTAVVGAVRHQDVRHGVSTERAFESRRQRRDTERPDRHQRRVPTDQRIGRRDQAGGIPAIAKLTIAARTVDAQAHRWDDPIPAKLLTKRSQELFRHHHFFNRLEAATHAARGVEHDFDRTDRRIRRLRGGCDHPGAAAQHQERRRGRDSAYGQEIFRYREWLHLGHGGSFLLAANAST